MRKMLCFIISFMVILTPLAGFAHSGGTDSYGGHHDYKNRSGLGSYHYHHGMGPHLHPNGVCPYSVKVTYNKSSISILAQTKLQELGYYTGRIDGSFGPKSQAALKAFQKDSGLEVDGSLGPISIKALGIN